MRSLVTTTGSTRSRGSTRTSSKPRLRTQRGAFFELQTDGFALLAIDTGILRSVDERQWAWIERALERSRGKFVMAIVGHPRIAGGNDIPHIAEGHDVSE